MLKGYDCVIQEIWDNLYHSDGLEWSIVWNIAALLISVLALTPFERDESSQDNMRIKLGEGRGTLGATKQVYEVRRLSSVAKETEWEGATQALYFVIEVLREFVRSD